MLPNCVLFTPAYAWATDTLLVCLFVDCTVLLPEKVGVIRPISRDDPREEEVEGTESPELKPRPIITANTNLNRVNNNNNSNKHAIKEMILIEKPSVIVPMESWIKNTQVRVEF